MQPIRTSSKRLVGGVASVPREAIFREFRALPDRLPSDAISAWQRLVAVDDGRGLKRWVQGKRSLEIAQSIDLINGRVRDLNDDDLTATFAIFARPELRDVSNVYKFQLPALVDRVGNLSFAQISRVFPIVAADHRGVSRSVLAKFREIISTRLDRETPLVLALRAAEALAVRDAHDPLIKHFLTFAWSEIASSPKQRLAIITTAKKLAHIEHLTEKIADLTLPEWPTDELINLYVAISSELQGSALERVETQILSRPTLAVEEALEVLRASKPGLAMRHKAESIVTKYLSTSPKSSRKFTRILTCAISIIDDINILNLAFMQLLAKKEDFARSQLIDLLFLRVSHLPRTSTIDALIAECLRPPLPLTSEELAKLLCFAGHSDVTLLTERLLAVTPRDLSVVVDVYKLLNLPSRELPPLARLENLAKELIDDVAVPLKLSVLDKALGISADSRILRRATSEISACASLKDFENLGLRRGLASTLVAAVLRQAEVALTAESLCDQLVVWAKLGAVPEADNLIYQVLDAWRDQVGNIPHMISGLADLELLQLAPYVADYVLEELGNDEISERLIEGVCSFQLFDFDVTAAVLGRCHDLSLSHAVWWRAVKRQRPDVARAVRLQMPTIFHDLEQFSLLFFCVFFLFLMNFSRFGPSPRTPRQQHPPGVLPGRHPTGVLPGRHPTGVLSGRHPTGVLSGRHPTGVLSGRHPTGVLSGRRKGLRLLVKPRGRSDESVLSDVSEIIQGELTSADDQVFLCY